MPPAGRSVLRVRLARFAGALDNPDLPLPDPAVSTHAEPSRKTWTVPMLADAKRDGRKLVMLTAYDASFARCMDEAGIDLVLVGDSLGMVVQGQSSTLPVSVDDIVYHTACVARGLSQALLISDLPFQADATPDRCATSRASGTSDGPYRRPDSPVANAITPNV